MTSQKGKFLYTQAKKLYCIALYCIALYFVVFHCIALHCIVLYCIALYFVVLYCIALHCIALLCITLHCIALYQSSEEGVGLPNWRGTKTKGNTSHNSSHVPYGMHCFVTVQLHTYTPGDLQSGQLRNATITATYPSL